MIPMVFSGRVERGEGMARRLGCPTANVSVQEGALIPALGVYLAETELEARWHPSVVCVNDGRGGTRLKMEVHLMHTDCQDLQGKFLSVRLLQKLRDLVPWEGEEKMKEVIADDLRMADQWFKLPAPHLHAV